MTRPVLDANVRARDNPRTIALELGIVAAVAAYYILGNRLFEGDHATAIANARSLITFQGLVGLNWEKGVQAFFQPHAWAMDTFVFFYAGPHFVLTYGFLVWTYWRRFDAYAYVRNAFLFFTVSAFTFQWIFPVAPPRMIPELGLGDTVTRTLPINGETPWIKALVNDVAALPSVHTGWSLLVAIYAMRLTSHRLRVLWAAYPAMIMLSVVATANHYIWDIVAAVAWLGLTETVHAVVADAQVLPRVCPTIRPQRAAVPLAFEESAA